MIAEVSLHIRKKRLLDKNSRVLVACSGGVDSMTVMDILSKLGYSTGLAHCNFELRGKESDDEQVFAEKYALEKEIPFFTINFNTRQFATKNKLTIQEAARFLRYTWLEEVRNSNDYTHIVTAHHQDDQAETILQHIIRGTGLQGLQGIPVKNGHIIRPLLPFSRREILEHAHACQVPWMEDSSNAEIKYERNFIRHEIIPMLEKLNPACSRSIYTMGERMREAACLQEEWIGRILKKNIRVKGNSTSLSIGFLQQNTASATILYYWLKAAGFSSEQLPDIMDSLDSGNSGLVFNSATHRLLKDRKHLFLFAENAEKQNRILFPTLTDQMRFNNLEIKCSSLPLSEWNMKKSPRFAYFDAEKIQWPIMLRSWEEGDYFYPFGMGKRHSSEKAGKKKLSKYFKDEKLSAYQKENAVLLLSGDRVMWLLGHRIDDRFKVTEKTKTVLKMTITDGYEKE